MGSARRWPRALPVASERGAAPSLGLPSVSRGAARMHPTGTRPGPRNHAPWRAGGGAAFVPWTRPVGDLIRASARLIVKCRCLLKVRTRACTLRAPVRPGGGFDARSTAAPHRSQQLRGGRVACVTRLCRRVARASTRVGGRSWVKELRLGKDRCVGQSHTEWGRDPGTRTRGGRGGGRRGPGRGRGPPSLVPSWARGEGHVTGRQTEEFCAPPSSSRQKLSPG